MLLKYITNDNLVLIIVITVVSCIVWQLTRRYEITVEGFGDESSEIETRQYYEYKETLLDHGDGVDTDKLYKNYNGSLEGKRWDNMTLEQCHDTCNKLDGCIGFSRDNVLPNIEATCYPRTAISKCHSIRKGDAKQRNKAVNYNTYIKSDIPNQLTRCLGDANITMNRLISIKSVAKPNNYVAIDDNEVVVKQFKLQGTDFIKQCRFKIIAGLEGSGTVSFMLTDNFDKNYYLADTGNNTLGIVQINDNNNNFNTRSSASFELLDGISNNHALTLRTYSDVNDNGYLKITNTNTKTPRIELVKQNKVNEMKGKSKLEKELTFEIVDIVSNTSIINKSSNNAQTKSTKNSVSSKNSSKTSEEIYNVLDSKLAPKPTSTKRENCCGSNSKRKRAYKKKSLNDKKNKKTREKFVDDLEAEIALDKVSEKSKCGKEYNLHYQLGEADKEFNLQTTSLSSKQLETNYSNELKRWREAVKNSSDKVIEKQKDLIDRGQFLNNNADKLDVNVRELSNDYFFLKNQSNLD